MASTFGGIELGKRALQTQQKSLDVVGHNIANAANENYSRQRAVQTTTTPYTSPSMYNSTGAGQIGTGVYVKEIGRMRDQFIDTRIRYENQGLGAWSIRKDNLQQIESIYNELDNGGLKNNLDIFFQRFQDLVDDPESSNSTREAVIQTAVTLTEQMNHINTSLMEFRGHLGSEIEDKIDEVNDITTKIADLNKQIKAIEADTTKAANDLCDERDALIDDLSKIIDIQVRINDENQARISLNGIGIVSGSNSKDIVAEANPVDIPSEDGNRLYNNGEFDEYTFTIGDNEARIDGGEIYGLMTVREDIVDQKANKLDLLAERLIEEVNAIHTTGYGKNDLNNTNPPNREFFLGADASDIRVNDNGTDGIIGHPENIAVAPDTEDSDNNGENDLIGDQSLALEIAQLVDTPISELGNATFNEFWQTQASQLGIQISQAEAMETNQNVLIDSLDEKKQEISGVSLDEEMTEMVKFQHAYNAASRVVSVMDEMLDTLINGII